MSITATEQQNRLPNGEFTFKYQSEADATLGYPRPESDFINEKPERQEAADFYFAGRPWASAEDFEDACFETYVNQAELRRDESNPDSGLMAVATFTHLIELPSGGYAVFYDEN